MIDTDKYEGHTEGEWRWYEGARHKSLTGSMRLLMFAEDGNNEHPKPADAALIEDAPKLLAEVKRLRKGIIDIADKWERPSILRGFLKELKELIE
tara:strand:+ start:1198 stop:1482 length:285 start_codon:yes stop_codon:yes gene_type:complete